MYKRQPLPDAHLDPVSKWMLITRSYVFEMNIYAGIVGILLALQFITEDRTPIYYDGAIVIIGLILAHAANNMMNDFFDTLHGVDTEGYPRTEYGPHALIDNLISTKGLILAIFLCNLVDLIIAIYFYQKVGLEILYFVFAGLTISIFSEHPVRLFHYFLKRVL